ncbi:MAG: hypothetical protein FWH10_01625 [Oscillospiraceae bacterium]|nr:hypothetical protein [Oscillospiraceae bacterium]
MSEIISRKERDYIRELAKKQLETANGKEMLEKEALWYTHNDCKSNKRPMITLERGTFNREFEHLWKPVCESETARNIEYYFHSNYIQYEYICDDTVMPKEFAIGIWAGLKPFDIDVKQEKRINETFAYKLDYPLKDLEEDFHRLKKSPRYCNFENSENYKKTVEDIIGDIMPVRLSFGPYVGLAANINCLMGLETMMISMYDYPELFHKMMQMLTDDYLELWDWAEKNNYIYPNNFNTGTTQGSYGFSRDIVSSQKQSGFNLGDTWGYAESQETSEISPDMYHEFFFPYYKKVTEKFGRLGYGCCESVSAIWEKSASNYSNLRKLSVSPWCDEEYIGDKLKNTNITYHRKPFPNHLSIDKIFDEKTFASHIEKSLKAAKGCFFEISYRDVYSLQGELYRGKKAYNIIMDCIEKFWR